jgi:flagellar biogenesis protein FliO
MLTTFQIVIVMLIVFAIYVVAKVISYMKQSEQQWKQVDKSKLKEWQDEDD